MAPLHHEDVETSSISYYSTPKLSLSKLPNKPIRNNTNNNNPLAAAYTTPPLHPSVSIPFQWEEEPGKPKPPTTKSKTVRCLDLPPRLLLSSESGKITNTPSPTRVLDGPYVDRSFSSINGTAVEKKAEISGNYNNKDMMMRSWRWENFKENNNNRGVVVKGSFDFADPLNSTTSSACDFDRRQRNLPRFTRKGSFFTFSRTNSDLLGGIYESFKQAVPWRWRRAKSKRAV